MIDATEIFAVECNLRNKETHIQRLSKTIENNLELLATGNGNSDYLIIGIAATHEDAMAIADAFEQSI